jgi:hypothetical protein
MSPLRTRPEDQADQAAPDQPTDDQIITDLANQNPAPPTDEPKADEPKADEPKAKANGKADDLDMEFLATGAMMLASELAADTQPTRARNERQQVMDRKVKELHTAWTEKERPGTWDAMVRAGVVATYFTEPDKSAKLKSYVNKAASFHGVRVRWGTSFLVTRAHIEKFNLSEQYEGREAISFAILDKRPHPAPKNGKTEAKAKNQPA